MTPLMEQGALAMLSGLDLKGLIIKPGSSVLVLNEKKDVNGKWGGNPEIITNLDMGDFVLLTGHLS